MLSFKKIILVNPPVTAIREPWFDAPEFPRTALAALAGYLLQQGYHEVECLDAKFEKLNFDQALQRIVKSGAAIVGLCAYTNEIKPAAYLAGLVKKAMPHAHTVVGGPHLTAIPEQTLHEFPTIDTGIVGEGEETLHELCLALSENRPLENIQGLVHRTAGGHIILNAPRPRILDQNSLPMPAWHLLPPGQEYYIQTERGCPFNCIFCMNHNGRVARTRAPEKVIEEMEWLLQYAKPRRISFGDELFSVDMKRTHHLLDLMIAHRIGERISWDIQTHVNYVDDALFAKMKRARIARCEMGVETGDDEQLKKVGKAVGRTEILKAFGLAKKHGIVTGSFLIIGHPYETPRSIWNTIQLGIKINPTEPIIGTMVPYPGTEVARMAAKGEGGYKLITTDWDHYSKQINGALEFAHLTKRRLELYQLAGYTLIFLANGRFIDFAKFFWNYRTAALNLLRKVISGNTNPEQDLKPANYDEVLNRQPTDTTLLFDTARTLWKKTQSQEVKRAKEQSPQLLLNQVPV